MFPISSQRRLPCIEIADYWSREITPRVKPVELLDALIKAWWRGKLTAANGPSRTDMLRALYASYQDRIVFAIPALNEPASAKELPDGGVEVIRLWRVPLPNARPELWDDTNCSEAFEAVAEAWRCDRFELIKLSLGWIELTAIEFTRWVDANGWPPPTFWGDAEEKKEDANPVQKLDEKRAAAFVTTYIKLAGRSATQSGLEQEAKKANLRGGREHLRVEFHRRQRNAGVEVKRGRIPKSR